MRSAVWLQTHLDDSDAHLAAASFISLNFSVASWMQAGSKRDECWAFQTCATEAVTVRALHPWPTSCLSGFLSGCLQSRARGQKTQIWASPQCWACCGQISGLVLHGTSPHTHEEAMQAEHGVDGC